MIAVHPEAAKRAEELAAAALVALRPQLVSAAPTPRNYQPDTPIAGTITPGDLRGPIVSRQADRFGREIARYISDDQGTWGLEGDGYGDFLRAVRILHQQRQIRDLVSEKTVSDLVFEWLYETKADRVGAPLLEYVLPKLEPLIKEIEVIIPIFGLHVETTIQVGNVGIADLTGEEMETWRSASLKHARGKEAEVNQLHDRLKKKYQGRAAAHYLTRAEAEYGIQRAMEEAELSVAALRLFSVGAFLPERPTVVALSGRERVPRAAFVLLATNDEFTSSEYLLHAEDIEPWILDNPKITQALPRVVGHWSELLKQSERSSFQEIALRSMLLYSRATQYRNISEKLIHIFSGIESILLRNENEPISSSVADRLAFAVGVDLDSRLAIVRNLRDVYAMRSKFVHHALETPPQGDDLTKLEAFLVTISQFFINLRGAMRTHETKESFLDELDQRKYR